MIYLAAFSKPTKCIFIRLSHVPTYEIGYCNTYVDNLLTVGCSVCCNYIVFLGLLEERGRVGKGTSAGAAKCNSTRTRHSGCNTYIQNDVLYRYADAEGGNRI